ncbi:hypothetical protein BAUCODRAFT_39541, partial [Baudoinia panamericana UAMH 10762]
MSTTKAQVVPPFEGNWDSRSSSHHEVPHYCSLRRSSRDNVCSQRIAGRHPPDLPGVCGYLVGRELRFLRGYCKDQQRDVESRPTDNVSSYPNPFPFLYPYSAQWLLGLNASRSGINTMTVTGSMQRPLAAGAYASDRVSLGIIKVRDERYDVCTDKAISGAACPYTEGQSLNVSVPVDTRRLPSVSRFCKTVKQHDPFPL